jgi:uncharacterized membrane protein HdeD (DUF308 family)
MPFPYLDITNTPARHVLAFGLGVAQVVLGLMEFVRGFEQSSVTAVLNGLKVTVEGILAIYAVISEQERSWEHVCRQMFSIVLLIVSSSKEVDDLFTTLVKRGGHV